MREYKSTARARDCHAVPEIAAAVQAFVTSREAQPGIYIYFDVGGGTLDGVAFKYVNWDGERRINFLSAKVASLGLAVLANSLRKVDRSDEIQRALLNGPVTPALHEALAPYAEEVRALVGYVIGTAKRKDPSDWQRDRFQDTLRPRRRLGGLAPEQMEPLLIFVGGGGASSRWYQEAILSTYEHFGHGRAGIPPYELNEVPFPSDFAEVGIPSSYFAPFSVAYGLAVPYGEGPEIGLPSQFGETQPPLPNPREDVISYENSKDVYD